jgi:hypothetical protein
MESSERIKDLIALKIHPKFKVREWEPYTRKYDCQVIAELGVQFGNNLEKLATHSPKELVGVDCFKGDELKSRNDGGYSQEELDSQYKTLLDKVSDRPFIKIFREYTFEAVKRFPDEYFDLIYIDADHSYEGCSRDIRDWFPKMKTGCALTGDDYREAKAHRTGVKFGVIEAVNEFAKEKGLEVFELPRHGWAIIK